MKNTPVLRTQLLSTITAIIFLCVISAYPAAGQQSVEAPAKTEDEESARGQDSLQPKQLEKEQSATSPWLIYGGAALFGLGVAAIANNSDDSSSSSCNQQPVGASIGGSDWRGTLTIRARGYEGQQEVTAKITQCGSSVNIETSSTLAYGKVFNGSISSGRGMFMIDRATSLDWTTHFTKATGNAIDLYDYVNNFSDFDTLILRR